MTTLLAPPPRPPLAREPAPPRTPRLRRMRYEPEPGTGRPPPAAPTPPPAVPTVPSHEEQYPVRRAVAGLVRLALEVFDGRRPTSQLAPHFDAAALRYWRAAAQQRRMRTPARVERIVLCLPRAGAAEMAAVCEIDGRVRALAARFEQAAPTAGWRCTALRLG